MKFENDYIRIIIEKKTLSEEQKQDKLLKRKKRRPYAITAMLLVIAILAGTVYWRTGPRTQELQVAKEENAGESTNEPHDDDNSISAEEDSNEQGESEEYGQIEGEYISVSHLASNLQEKYADKSLYNYTYGEPIENVGRDEAITFKLGYDVADLGIEKWTEVFALYQDPDLTGWMGVKYSFDNATGIFTMEPSETSTTCKIGTIGLDVETVNKYPHSQYALYDNGAGTSWGNLGTAYLASYRDKETGELLDQPEVSIVTFRAEIEEAPKLSYAITDDGRPEFYWNEVEGAEEYLICQTYSEKDRGYTGNMKVLGITDGTVWTTESPEYSLWSIANKEFKTFRVSEDEWKNEWDYDNLVEKYGESVVGTPQYDTGEYAQEGGICVIAVNGEGTSMISNVFSNNELAPNLPYKTASNAEKENGFAPMAQTYESVETLPSYDYVTMCDGYTVTKLVDYDTEKAYVQDKRFMLLDDETGDLTGAETLACLCIPYRVEGTPFVYEFTISDYDEANLEKDKAYLEDREQKLRKKSGDVSPDFSLQLATQEDLKPEKIRQVKTTVFGNSALSEYLATNMLGGASVIDISEFPEAKDQRFVDDAFLEAYYQNPLILGIKGYRINRSGTAVRVSYEESLESQASKQQEIKEKVSEVIAEIITDDMTDQEKELAINQYLCDTIVYDEDALANAEENNFMYVDEIYNDSFTAYGALINGKCVCAGYAAAFRLLAQEAGLEAIVVTGFLNGSLSHAWNKVMIDGEWQIVDVTNNDNEYFFNALFNLPSSVGDRVLVEDKNYMLDKKIRQYKGESDENEYYHIMGSYFPTKEIAKELSKGLEENGEVTLRTDYELDDNDFYDITDAVYEIMGDDIKLYGYYWLGVIYLTTEI